MKLTVIGSSDAFGSGGRLQTCFHAAHPGGQFLIDCGATSLVGLARQGIDPNEISTIFISHLHGDHFAGLVWWLIHAVHVAKRTAPLTITGPVGIEKRFIAAAEALFPNSTTTSRAFDMQFVEYVERQPLDIGGVRVTPFQVSHPSGAPPYALRFEVGGKILAFSGDTEWVESLIDASMGSDLFICECSAFEAERPLPPQLAHHRAQSRPHRRQAHPAHAHGARDARQSPRHSRAARQPRRGWNGSRHGLSTARLRTHPVLPQN